MTGSLVQGTVEGLANGLEATHGKVVKLVDGTPVGNVTVPFASGLAFDEAAGQYYMGKTGTTWIKLGSVA